MKLLWYILTAVLGAIGILASLRFIELLMSGAGFVPLQLLIAFGMILLAVVCLRQARGVK